MGRNRYIVGGIAIAGLLGLAAMANAQPNCGTITTGLEAVQIGDLRMINYIAHTQREYILCEDMDVQAEGWITGVNGSAGLQRSGAYYVEVNKTVPTLSYGSFNVYSKHWIIFNLQWFFHGTRPEYVTHILPIRPSRRATSVKTTADSGTRPVSGATTTPVRF